MDCNVKAEITRDICTLNASVKLIDNFFNDCYHNIPATSLEPTAAFMAAWHKIKTVRDILSTITLREQAI